MRLIDVNELKEWIENWFTKNRFYHPYAKNNNIPIPELYDILEQMPTVERKTGIWRRAEYGYTCNRCGKTHLLRTAYCPSCGAEMDC